MRRLNTKAVCDALELCQAVSPCGFDVGIGDVGAAAGVGAGEPFQAVAQEPWTMHPDEEMS